MNVIVIAPSPNPKTLPPTSNASPSFVGRSAASVWAFSWSLSPMSVRWSICWKRSEARIRSTIVGRSSIRSRTAPTKGLIRRYERMPRKPITPSTTTIAALPRRILARSSSQLTGVCRTIARNSAMNTQSTACRAARNAQTKAATARTVDHRPRGDRDLDALRRRLRHARHGASLGSASAGARRRRRCVSRRSELPA